MVRRDHHQATINGEDMVSIDTDGNPEDTFEDQLIDEDKKTAEFKIRVGDKALLGEQTPHPVHD